MSILMIMAFVIYAFTLIGIGYYFSKKAASSSGFILGERSTNYWVTAIALQASDMSHWLFLGLPAVVYAFGLVRLWEAVGLVSFMFLSWHFIAPKIRVATEKYKALTLFSYFEKRFNDHSGIIRLLSAIISVIFLTFYVSSGLVALGRLFENTFGISYTWGMVLGLAITVIYTLVGGFVAVAWCDFFQGLFAVAMIILVPSVAYFAIGGWESIATAAAQKGVSLSIVPATASLGSILALIFTWGPGYFGQAQLISFFMGIDDPKKIKYAKYVGLTWQIIVLLFAIFLGLVGIAYFNTAADGQLIYILLTKKLFAPFVAGFVLCAILAVTLSTLDTQVLSVGAVFAEDIYHKLLHKKASSDAVLWISRLFSIAVCMVAIFIALDDSKTIYDLVNYAWAGMGSAFGPLTIASLYSKKVNKYGAIAGIITGATVSGAWYILDNILKIGLVPLIPGFISSALAIYLVSHITRKKA